MPLLNQVCTPLEDLSGRKGCKYPGRWAGGDTVCPPFHSPATKKESEAASVATSSCGSHFLVPLRWGRRPFGMRLVVPRSGFPS